MLTIPQRLLSQPDVDVWHHSTEVTILSKEVAQDIRHKTNFIGKHVITFIASGRQTIASNDGDSLQLEGGDIACIRKGLYSITDLISGSDSFRATLFFFDDTVLQDKKFGQSLGADFRKAKISPMLNAFVAGCRMLREANGFDGEIALLKMKELIHHIGRDQNLIELNSLLHDLRTPRSGSIIDVMEEHYMKSMTIGDYAYLTGRSESTFRREFKLKFGVTPRRWLMQRRLEQAHNLLAHSKTSVSDAAYEVGYDNVSHFIREYQKQYGVTPGDRVRGSHQL